MCPSEISGELTLLPPSLSFYNLETKTQTVQTQRNLNPSRHFFIVLKTLVDRAHSRRENLPCVTPVCASVTAL